MKTKKIKIYVTCFWQNDQVMLDNIKKYGFGKTTWKNIEFVIDNNYDFAIILTAPFDHKKIFNPNKTIVFLTEPPCFKFHTKENFTVSPQYIPLSWWIKSKHYHIINHTHSFINSKQELFSIITSDKRFWDGHKKRLKFIFAIDSLIEEGIDIYGRNSYGGNITENEKL